MVDPVEEFRDVQVHHVAVALADQRLCGLDGLMRRPLGSKAVALLGKDALEAGLQRLQQRLLKETVQHRFDAQLPRAASGLRDVHPSDRLRLVRPRKECAGESRPVLAQVRPQRGRGHAVDPWCSAVALDAVQGPLEIRPLQRVLQAECPRVRGRRHRFAPQTGSAHRPAAAASPRSPAEVLA